MNLELRLKLADDLQLLRPIRKILRIFARIAPMFAEPSKSDWIMSHCLLLAQALAIGFYRANIEGFQGSV